MEPAVGPTIRPRNLAGYHWPVPVLSLDDIDDERVTIYRSIRDKFARNIGLFVAEGRLVVRRLLESRFATQSVMVTPRGFYAVEDLVAARPDLPVYVVPQILMNAVVGFNIHRGCLAIGERPAPVSWEEVARGAQRLVALERVGDADNVGATFRAAAAFAADGLLLDEHCADPLYRKAVRTSMGAALEVPFATDVPWPATVESLKEEGWTILGLTPSPAAPPLSEVVAVAGAHRVVLVLGHEGEGLTAGALGACTHLARIRTTEAVDSLNVGMAAGIALYELSRAAGTSE